MTDYAQTITEYLNVSAPEPTSKWGTMEWGVDNWGMSGDHLVRIGKVITDTTTITDALTFATTKLLAETLVLTDVFCKGAFTTRSESLTLSQAISDLLLIDQAGYFHVFISDVTDVANRASTTWTDPSDPLTDWTEQTDPSTIWS
tara:strand:- start:2613 stop:3047 length:435 start_codon:yes stop_codon:yes gene_type:complete